MKFFMKFCELITSTLVNKDPYHKDFWRCNKTKKVSMVCKLLHICSKEEAAEPITTEIIREKCVPICIASGKCFFSLPCWNTLTNKNWSIIM